MSTRERVVVTGGAGFIGSSVVHTLVRTYDVLVVDDLSTGRIENLHPVAAMRTMDILDTDLPEVIARFKPAVVVHLAAQSSVPRSIDDPERDWAVNVDGTRAVARAARDAGARLVLSASSAAVYGEPTELPVRESHPAVPLNPYGRSKAAAEEALMEELGGTACDHASLRFSNVYGPRQDASGEGGVVAAFCFALSEGDAPTIHGDGEQTRDFVFVGDVVAAIMAAMGVGARLDDPSRAGGGAYNIATGQEVSIQHLAHALRPIAEFLAPFHFGPAREADIARSVLDSSKAYAVFGWKPSVPLESGLSMTYRWFAARRAAVR